MRDYPEEFEGMAAHKLPVNELKGASHATLVDMLLRIHRNCNRIAREMRFKSASEDETQFRLRMAWEVEDVLFGIEFPDPPNREVIRIGEVLPECLARGKWREARQQMRDDEGWDWSSEQEEQGHR